MHILLVASAESVWTQKYIENVLLPTGYSVLLLSPHNTIFRDYYAAQGIPVATTHGTAAPQPSKVAASALASTPSLKNRIRELLKTFMPTKFRQGIRHILMGRPIRRAMRTLPAPDVIHMHYISPDMEHAYAPLLRGFTGKLVLTYWGSDLFRITTEPCNKQLLEKATAVTFMTTGLRDRFQEIYGAAYDAKLHVIDFGVSVYDHLDALEGDPTSREESRAMFGIPAGKLCVMAGYNANPGQQHLAMIEALKALPEALTSQLHVVLQYSYNYTQDADYYEKVENALRSAPFSWQIIDTFLDDAASARLRCAVDIFIHAQLTDALSASMLEYLYAGAIVLNGAWLTYHELKSREIAYEGFDDFSHLTEQLKTTIVDFDARKKAVRSNRAALYAMNSWSAVRATWCAVYAEPKEDKDAAK